MVILDIFRIDISECSEGNHKFLHSSISFSVSWSSPQEKQKKQQEGNGDTHTNCKNDEQAAYPSKGKQGFGIAIHRRISMELEQDFFRLQSRFSSPHFSFGCNKTISPIQHLSVKNDDMTTYFMC